MLKLNTEWEWHAADAEVGSYWICHPLGRDIDFYLCAEYRGEIEDPEADVEWEVFAVMDGRGDVSEIFRAHCPGTAAEVKRYLLDELGQIFLSLGAQLCREPVTPVLRQLHTHRPFPAEREELLGLDVFGRVWRRKGRIWERLVGSLM